MEMKSGEEGEKGLEKRSVHTEREPALSSQSVLTAACLKPSEIF